MAIENVRITKVYRSDKNKEGKEFKDKNGKKFWRVAIQVDLTGDEWWSCLAYSQDDYEYKLEEGQEKMLVLEKKGDFNNFRLPMKIDILENRVIKLEQNIKMLLDKYGVGITSAGTKVPDFSEVDKKEVDPDEIPF